MDKNIELNEPKTAWLIDGLIGVVPLVGDVFDVMFKVNERNMDLLASDLQRRGLLS